MVTKPIDQDGTFDEAVKGVSVIAHTASPTTFTPEDSERDVMIPAIRGTTGILRSAALEHSVKAIVITSSIVAFLDLSQIGDPGYKLTDKS